jgi:hypothetical protein
MRVSKKCVKFAFFDCDNSDRESEPEEQNVSIQVKEIEATEEVSTNEEEDKVSTNEEEDFYVINEEVTQNAIVE